MSGAGGLRLRRFSVRDAPPRPPSAMSVEEEVRAADIVRVAATVRGDADGLAALLSSGLH